MVRGVASSAASCTDIVRRNGTGREEKHRERNESRREEGRGAETEKRRAGKKFNHQRVEAVGEKKTRTPRDKSGHGREAERTKVGVSRVSIF